MTEVVSVRFNNKGKIYFFDPAGNQMKSGDQVIVETAKGIEFAECAYGNHMVEDTAVMKPIRPIVRLATPADIKTARENKSKEGQAFEYCQKKIADFGLDMKLVNVEFSFDGSKILFFFTSEGRVDFRELVKDLASMFRTRIELRQIGVRDEARILGGLGVCGKQFCCSQFLGEFHPVSIKMAKTQGLSLNPTKISGTCGRLMCCLKYEEIAYEDLVKKAPKLDAFVETPAGKGSVISVNLLRGCAKVRLEDGADTALKTFTFGELEVLGGKARRAEYITARAEGRLEEAGFKPTPVAPPAPRRLEPSLFAARPQEEIHPAANRRPPYTGGKSGGGRPRDAAHPQAQKQTHTAPAPGGPQAEKKPPVKKRRSGHSYKPRQDNGGGQPGMGAGKPN